MRVLGSFAHFFSVAPAGLVARFREQDDEEGIEVPQPTYAFGAMGPLDFNEYKAEPSQDEIDARQVVERALDTTNRWPS